MAASQAFFQALQLGSARSQTLLPRATILHLLQLEVEFGEPES